MLTESDPPWGTVPTTVTDVAALAAAFALARISDPLSDAMPLSAAAVVPVVAVAALYAVPAGVESPQQPSRPMPPAVSATTAKVAPMRVFI